MPKGKQISDSSEYSDKQLSDSSSDSSDSEKSKKKNNNKGAKNIKKNKKNERSSNSSYTSSDEEVVQRKKAKDKNKKKPKKDEDEEDEEDEVEVKVKAKSNKKKEKDKKGKEGKDSKHKDEKINKELDTKDKDNKENKKEEKDKKIVKNPNKSFNDYITNKFGFSNIIKGETPKKFILSQIAKKLLTKEEFELNGSTIHDLYNEVKDFIIFDFCLTDNGYAIYTRESEYNRFISLIKTSVVGKFTVEVSGYLHILLCNQIRNYIYYRENNRDPNYNYGRDPICCKEVFDELVKLHKEDEKSNIEENRRYLSMIIDKPITEIIHSKCEFQRKKSNSDEDYFDFEFKGSYNKYEAICDFIRKFQQSLKSHALISKNQMAKEATEFLFFKYINEILDCGEEILNKEYKHKKDKDNNNDPKLLRPNIVIEVCKINLKGKRTIEKEEKGEKGENEENEENEKEIEKAENQIKKSNGNADLVEDSKTNNNDQNNKFNNDGTIDAKYRDKGVIMYIGTATNNNRLLDYYIQCIEVLCLRIQFRIDLAENLFSEVAEVIQKNLKRDAYVKININKRGDRPKTFLNIFLPPISINCEEDKNFRDQNERMEKLLKEYKAIASKQIEDFKIITEDYKFEGFMKGKYRDTDIRARAAKEKLHSIVLKTELETNVKILHPDLCRNEFNCRITGQTKNVKAAKKKLEELFNDRINKFKSQLMPYRMCKFCNDKKLLESDCKLWSKYNVEIRRGTNDYRGTHHNFVDIIGSSKSVDTIYKEILRRIYEDFNFQNEDGDCFNNKISLPPHYLKCLKIQGYDTDKYKDIGSIQDFIDKSNEAEKIINDIKLIKYPQEWIDFNVNKTCIQRVDKKSLEYKEIEEKFHKGYCKVDKIQKIERIINPFLWNLYHCKKRELLFKHFKNCDHEYSAFEESLWHGTSKTSPLLPACLSDEGIDRRFQKKIESSKEEMKESNTAAKYYGIGCYFSTTSGYSDNQYSYYLRGGTDDNAKTGLHQLLLCKVLVGSYDFGMVALEKDQMRTLKGKTLNDVVGKLVELQEPTDIKAEVKKLNDLKNELSKKNKNKSEIEKDIKRCETKIRKNKDEWTTQKDMIYYPDRKDYINSYLKGNNKVKLQMKDDLKYDSIMDDRFMIEKLNKKVGKPRMYVTFDNAQSYPAYLITYDRQNKKTDSKD